MNATAIGVAAVAALLTTTLPAHAQSEKDVQEVIQEFEKGDPGMKGWFKDAHGYAVFPSVGKGAIGVGGAHGKGLVYERGVPIGKTTLTAVSIGFQLGGQAFREVIFFKDKTALDDFTRGNFEFAAGLSAVALKAGASEDLGYNKGVAVMTATKGGLMYEASVGGQKFSFEKSKKSPLDRNASWTHSSAASLSGCSLERLRSGQSEPSASRSRGGVLAASCSTSNRPYLIRESWRSASQTLSRTPTTSGRNWQNSGRPRSGCYNSSARHPVLPSPHDAKARTHVLRSRRIDAVNSPGHG